MRKIVLFMKRFIVLKNNDYSSANTVIYYMALSFFVLSVFALAGAFVDVAFLVSFAFSGLFFTIYDSAEKKNGIMLFLGILFTITIPQILKFKAVHQFISWILIKLSLITHGALEISSASVGNALTIASLGLVLISLWNKNQRLKFIENENERLNETITQQAQQEDWAKRFEQINQLDDLDEQIMQLTAIIKNEQDPAIVSRALGLRGYIYKRNNLLEKALADYNKAIELSSENASLFYNRGILKRLIGDKEEALKDYTKAIDLDPNYVSAYNNRGILLKGMGKQEEALQDYTKAIQLNPDYAFAYNNRGNLWSDMGKQEEALKDYERAIELDPDYAEAYNNRGNLLKDMGKQAEALADYTRAIALKPDYALAYKNRGNLLKKMGKQEEALQDYKKAVQFNASYGATLDPIIESLRLSIKEAAAGKEQ